MTHSPITKLPYTIEDADRILGLGDQFLEDWEADEGKDAESRANCAERRAEWDAIRPLLAEAPALLLMLRDAQASMTTMRHQIDQMRGMFPDEDHTIQDACDEHEYIDGAIDELVSLIDSGVTPAPVSATVGENQYLVEWQIDIWANTPEEAAEKARLIQQRHDSAATVFQVTDKLGDEVTIDMLDAPRQPQLGGPS